MANFHKQIFAARVKLTKFGGRAKWAAVGTGFQMESGQINLVMDTMPIDKTWDGTIVLFPVEE